MSEQRLEELSVLLSAMSNRKRLEILILLLEGELSVSALVDKIGISQSSLSQHLAILRNADLVVTQRRSHLTYYSCKSHEVAAVVAALNIDKLKTMPRTETPVSQEN